MYDQMSPPPILYLLHYQWRIQEILSEAHVRSALFRDITQLIVVIPYRRFGTTRRSHLQDKRDGLSRNVGKEVTLCAA